MAGMGSGEWAGSLDSVRARLGVECLRTSTFTSNTFRYQTCQINVSFDSHSYCVTMRLGQMPSLCTPSLNDWCKLIVRASMRLFVLFENFILQFVPFEPTVCSKGKSHAIVHL